VRSVVAAPSPSTTLHRSEAPACSGPCRWPEPGRRTVGLTTRSSVAGPCTPQGWCWREAMMICSACDVDLCWMCGHVRLRPTTSGWLREAAVADLVSFGPATRGRTGGRWK
jgi:hypothetical protein